MKGIRTLESTFIIWTNTFEQQIQLADKPGLHEVLVENMNEFVKALDAIGEKVYFRQQMGMKRQVMSFLCSY